VLDGAAVTMESAFRQPGSDHIPAGPPADPV
jgi:hypothetical protein